MHLFTFIYNKWKQIVIWRIPDCSNKLNCSQYRNFTAYLRVQVSTTRINCNRLSFPWEISLDDCFQEISLDHQNFKQRKHSCSSVLSWQFLIKILLLNILCRENFGNGQGHLDRQTGNKREPFFLSSRFILDVSKKTSAKTSAGLIVWW